MNRLVQFGLTNALMAAGLALVVAVLARFTRRRPALAHGLWVLVLLRLLAPPFWTVPLAWPGPGRAAFDFSNTGPIRSGPSNSNRSRDGPEPRCRGDCQGKTAQP